MVKCKDCHQKMEGSESCTWKYVLIKGEVFKRNTEYLGNGMSCHDCGITNKKGNTHHFGCDIEQCPKCGGQIISCGCGVTGLIKDYTTEGFK